MTYGTVAHGKGVLVELPSVCFLKCQQVRTSITAIAEQTLHTRHATTPWTDCVQMITQGEGSAMGKPSDFKISSPLGSVIMDRSVAHFEPQVSHLRGEYNISRAV